MRIITVSREFGSGGRELGKRMSDILGFDYYDRELITAIAQKKGLDAGYVENTLNRPLSPPYSFTFRRSFSTPQVLHVPQTDLLISQKQVIEEIAAAGRDCIIIGRNADILLRDYQPLNLFVCAAQESKIRRCVERAESGEQLSEFQIRQHMRRIDQNRARTRELLTSSSWGERTAYHLIINTTDWDMKSLAVSVAEFALAWFRRT